MSGARDAIAKAFAEAWHEHPANTEADAQVALDALEAAGYEVVPTMNQED